MMSQLIRLIQADWLYGENQSHRFPFIEVKVKVTNYIVAPNLSWVELAFDNQMRYRPNNKIYKPD